MSSLKSTSLFIFAAVSLLRSEPHPAPHAAEHRDELVHLENFVVSATPFKRDQSEIASATNVLTGRALALKQEPTLGATLDREPGIASTQFGPGASRPVIRGLGGDRVRVLTNSTGTMDASVVSPDHAVSIDPLVLERIEVVRGPATLLYGSNAVGGVVNALDNRIPAELPKGPFTGRAEARFGTAAQEGAVAAVFEGAAEDVAWHVDASRRESDDVKIPGFADASDPVNKGRLTNSALFTTNIAAGLSYIGKHGFAGASGSQFESKYGAVAESDVTIKLKQRRLDLRGESNEASGIFSGARASFGVADYRHTEFEGAETGTRFTNKGYEGRAELLHDDLAGLSGSWGAQITHSDFAAIGEEAFLPPSNTETYALFAFEEYRTKPVTYQFGARLEHQTIAPDTARRKRDTYWSGSAGLVYTLPAHLAAAVTVTHSERAANAQERFSDGPHVGTGSFDRGDPSLALEKSTGLDVSLRRRKGMVTGALTGFLNRFDGFIFAEATGLQDPEGLEIYQYVQRDVEMYGAELEILVHLHDSAPHSLDLRFTADLVKAKQQDSGESLPRITPRRAGVAVDYRRSGITASLGFFGVDRAHRVAVNETETAGYGLLNAHVSYHFDVERTHFEVFLRGTNLTDRLARNHVSFLKDVAPLPGRDVTLAVGVAF